MQPLPRSAITLSCIAATAAAVASVLILTWPGAFPPRGGSFPVNPPQFNQIWAEARGWSVATLALGLPLLLAGLRGAMRGRIKARLVWLGALAYLVYTFLEFAASPPFTRLFLVYVVTLATALVALVGGVVTLDIEQVAREFSPAPRRAVAVFALVLGVGLALAWVKSIVVSLATGLNSWPQGAAAVRHVVYALDLGLQVPLAITTGVLFLRRSLCAYSVGAIMLINSVCMAGALTLMVGVGLVGSGSALWPIAPFALVFIVAAWLALAFFGSRASRARVSPSSATTLDPLR